MMKPSRNPRVISVQRLFLIPVDRAKEGKRKQPGSDMIFRNRNGNVASGPGQRSRPAEARV